MKVTLVVQTPPPVTPPSTYSLHLEMDEREFKIFDSIMTRDISVPSVVVKTGSTFSRDEITKFMREVRRNY